SRTPFEFQFSRPALAHWWDYRTGRQRNRFCGVRFGIYSVRQALSFDAGAGAGLEHCRLSVKCCFIDSSSLGGLLTRIPNRFCIDRLIGAMIVIAREGPALASSASAVPLLRQFFKPVR